MNSLQKPANIKQRPRSYSDEATPRAARAATQRAATQRAATATARAATQRAATATPRAATATPRAATAAQRAARAATATPRAATAASSTRSKSISEKIKSVIKSVKTSIIGKKDKNKSQLVSTVEVAVSNNLEILQDEVLADVKKIENNYPNISNRDENGDFIYQIDETVKGLVIHLHKALEFTEHTRALFGQEPEAKQEPEPEPEPETQKMAKNSLTEEEQQDILFDKVNKLIEVLATYLLDEKEKFMLKFNKNNDTPVKYTLTIIGLGIDINYATLNDLLKIISSRIQAVIVLCFFGCNDKLKKALKDFKTTYNAKTLNIKQLYLNFLNILSAYITNNKNLKYNMGDKIVSEIPTEVLTLLNDKSVGGKRNKRKPKKAAKAAAKKKASK